MLGRCFPLLAGSLLLCLPTPPAARAQMTPQDADRHMSRSASGANHGLWKQALTADRQTLRRYLSGEDAALARYAASEAARRGDKALLPTLRARLQDRRGGEDGIGASVVAARSLYRLDPAGARPALREALRDPRFDLRVSVALMLAKTGDRTTLPVLREGLKRSVSKRTQFDTTHSARDTRFSAVDALVSLRDREALPHLRRLQGTLTGQSHTLVTFARTRLGDPNAVVQTRAVLSKSWDATMRAVAVRTLRAIGGRENVAAIAAALQDRAPGVRYEAACALRILGDPSHIAPLRRAANETSPDAASAPRKDEQARRAAQGAAHRLSRSR